MVSGIQKTAELVQEISQSTAEQASGIGQINESIRELDIIIQLNTSAAKEMASASRDFAAHAQRLLESASFFKVPEELVKEIQPKDEDEA
jgi:methyl-accepting chemotaxis protein